VNEVNNKATSHECCDLIGYLYYTFDLAGARFLCGRAFS
jgi:hypothetical protein